MSVAGGGTIMSRAEDGDLKPFPATRWTLVARAGQGSAPVKREALGVLLERYLPALRAYLVARRHLPRERVEDILQGFVSDKILEQDLIAQAQPEKGKFRSLLLVALNRYLVGQIRREKAQKRSPRGSEVASLGDEPLDYDQLVRQLGLETPLQACNLLITAKRMFARALREVAGEYVGDDRNVDEELGELKAVLGGIGA
jgi:RNA polymerase sigma-70 factor (ECF subfamily)